MVWNQICSIVSSKSFLFCRAVPLIHGLENTGFCFVLLFACAHGISRLPIFSPKYVIYQAKIKPKEFAIVLFLGYQGPSLADLPVLFTFQSFPHLSLVMEFCFKSCRNMHMQVCLWNCVYWRKRKCLLGF